MKKKCNIKFTACILQCLLVPGLWALHFAFSTITYAAIAPKSAIFSGREVTITIGLSNNYVSIYGESPNFRSNCIHVDGTKRRLCASYVFGNDFQLLDWLENGLIDGAVVPPLTLKVLHTSDRQPFKDHFVVARYDAFAKKSLANYHIGLSAPQSGDAQKTPLERYQGYLKGLLTDAPVPANKITMDSHLSPAMGLFLVTTDNWLKTQSPSAKQRDQFWKRVFKQTVFALSRPTARDTTAFSFYATQNNIPPDTYVLTESPVRDYLLLRLQAVPEILFSKCRVLRDDKTIRDTYQQIVPDYLPTPKQKTSLPKSLKKFINDNFTGHQMGSQVRRYFRFTIPELLHLLHSAANDGDGDGGDIALVLTGGGVKAAYQTKLVDHLYEKAYLSNMTTNCPASLKSGAQPLTVKYVIGTSGGALLGMFVAAIKKCGTPNFSKLLWFKKKEEYITFSDVFPPIDMLRWLSFLTSFLIFSFVATILYKIKWVRQRLGFEARVTAANSVEDTGGRFFRFSLVWIAFLSLTPFLIRYVNGEELAEHIPEMQGFFYFVFALIGVHTDNHIIRVDSLTPEDNNEKKRKPKPIITWTLLSGGLLLTILSLAHRQWGIFDRLKWNLNKTWGWLEEMLSWKMTTNVFIFCLGLLLIAFFIQRWYFHRSRHFRSLEPGEGDVKGSYCVLLLVPILSALFIYIQYKADWVSALELTLSFWAGLLLATILTAMLIFTFAALGWPKDLLRPRLCFLLSRHPNRWGLRMNRHTRILIMFTLAWGWWNIVIGPGIYGNDNSQEYIKLVFKKIEREQGWPPAPENSAQAKKFSLQTYFVVPATSLETKSERYFMFNPQIPAIDGQRNAIRYLHQLAISSDPRWTQFSAEEQDKETLAQIAFASGSPFPVFPTHKITIGDKVEKLIDGGYSHNTPIEAAKTLGADRLLVIYSSPLDTGTIGQPGLLQKVFGTMVQNLPRLFPYLYQRSQVEDLLSAKEVLVAALAPTGHDDGSKWPFLTDFRHSVVESMLHQAERDLDRRIGTIQNWGLPEE